MKLHFAIGYEGRYGYVSTTLCGRGHSCADSATDNNVTEDRRCVSCELCKQIIQDPNHWRHRKYLSG